MYFAKPTCLPWLRELNNVKTTIRMITNPPHPIRPFCVGLKIIDAYVYRPATPKPLYVRASKTVVKIDIDPRKIKKTPHYHRPPWIETNIDQYDLELCIIERGAMPATNVSAKKRPAFWKTSTKTMLRSTHRF
jgi:hypothetical protein